MERKKLRILIITGILTREHDMSLCEALRTLLEATGVFEVRITEEFAGATDATLKSYDAVLVNYDGKFDPEETDPPLWSESSQQALFSFVRSGKGAVIYHSSLIFDAGWPDDYKKLMGGYIDFADYGRKVPGDDFELTIQNTEHPITRNLPQKWMTCGDDLFADVRWHKDADAEVLVTARDDVELYLKSGRPAEAYPNGDPSRLPGVNSDVPVMWTNKFGKGRVFCCSIGHNIDTIRRRTFCALLCRGVEWAATGGVTLPDVNCVGDQRLRRWPYYPVEK